MGSDHIRMVRPEHIRESLYSVGELTPMFPVGESTHVIKNAHDFLLGQRHVLREKNDRLVTMSFDSSCLLYTSDAADEL